MNGKIAFGRYGFSGMVDSIKSMFNQPLYFVLVAENSSDGILHIF